MQCTVTHLEDICTHLIVQTRIDLEMERGWRMVVPRAEDDSSHPPKTSKPESRKSEHPPSLPRPRSADARAGGFNQAPFWANSVVCIQREGRKSKRLHAHVVVRAVPRGRDA